MRTFVAEVQPADHRTSQLETSGNTARRHASGPAPKHGKPSMETWEAKPCSLRKGSFLKNYN